ncbi:hypothetical protein Cni_G27262 [Canna indica]|uniref:Glycosyltransferase 61 catalytic domain-containing protein n=1 Tax=Canna indica TaxID=4628 RepID=A0AAQ3QR81_9LILI|nr:hypothetical protein Cni_G27262 [Canna indica]
MGYEPKLGKKFIQFDFRSFGLGLIVGCLLVSTTYISLFRTDMDLVALWKSSQRASPTATETLTGLSRLGKQHGNVTREGETATKNFLSTRNKSEGRRQPICDLSQYRTDICDIQGDIRIVWNGSSPVTLVNPPGTSRTSESWEIKLYARKADRRVIRRVPKVKVKSLHGDQVEESPHCSVTHAVPGVVFATTGYVGNIFHDFSDVLIPLFQTTRQFKGQVQFLIANNKPWWIRKYHHVLNELSAYNFINLENDDRVHCFEHAIVGLQADKDLMIDTAKSPEGLSMVDFVQLLRSAYSLKRARPWPAGKEPGRRPRLLFISRGRSRRFMNLDEIVPVAEEVGFEVVSAEPKFMDVAKFAETVNSVDVMVGVHGAGLTNMVFLPTDAILIQVVPLAKLDWIAEHYYAMPALGMKLRHLQYNITTEESTLIQQYPRDHAVFTDPDSIRKEGWQKMAKIYLVEQNVRLDKDRFRGVLKEAIELLN